MFQETLKELFPSWEAVSTRYREVVLFVAGLMKDSRPLVQFVYEMQVEYYLDTMRTGNNHPSIDDTDLFRSLQAESSFRLFDDPLHNTYINLYNHGEDDRKEKPRDITLFYPSRLYHFVSVRQEVVWKDHQRKGLEIPPCAIYIFQPDETISDILLSTCSRISRHQAVTDLWMERARSKDSILELRMTNPQSLSFLKCVLPESYIETLLRQLFGCGDFLKRLWVYRMNLRPFESLLDELLEDLVAHHEVGLAQRKLRLELRGDNDNPSNLSEEFVWKWRNRCEKVDSIECEIEP